MDIIWMIFLSIIVAIVVLVITFYIYGLGYNSGFAEGKNHNPYDIVLMGWELRLPDSGGIIKLVKDEESGGVTHAS